MLMKLATGTRADDWTGTIWLDAIDLLRIISQQVDYANSGCSSGKCNCLVVCELLSMIQTLGCNWFNEFNAIRAFRVDNTWLRYSVLATLLLESSIIAGKTVAQHFFFTNWCSQESRHQKCNTHQSVWSCFSVFFCSPKSWHWLRWTVNSKQRGNHNWNQSVQWLAPTSSLFKLHGSEPNRSIYWLDQTEPLHVLMTRKHHTCE